MVRVTRRATGRKAAFTPLLLLASALGAAPVARAAAPMTGAVILDGVTIVDTHDGALKPGMAIRIEGGKITRIGRAHSLKATGGATLIDATGKFVVPGYNDMHAHPLNSAGPQISLPLMVANGITGFRQMAGSDELLKQRHDGTLHLPPVSPELLATPGMVLAGKLSGDPQATIAEVRKQKTEGADFIKTVDLGSASFYAALDEAKAVGLPYAGHLPPSVDVREASRRGMKSIEHLGPTISILEACSSDEPAIRAAIAHAPPSSSNIAFNLPLAALKRLTADPLILLPPPAFVQIQHVIDTYSDDKCRALAKTLAATATWQVPTLIRLKAMEFSDDPAFANDPNLRYVLADDLDVWRDVAKSFDDKLSPASRATLAQLFPYQLKLVKLFDDAGVKMLAGTDFGGQWLVAGFSLHQEFDLLAKAGLSPLRVLQMTTLNGAQFLGREARMGSVGVGKDANLVLLDGNPVASVDNLHRIDAVVRAGTYYSRGALDDIKQQALQARSTNVASSAPALGIEPE